MSDSDVHPTLPTAAVGTLPIMIRRILVANRGEIARRVFRTCRQMGIETVAVFSDADAHALHALEADQAVPIGPPEPTASYLDMDRIIDAAVSTGADAIHPGYGFLSENAAFARACGDAGIIFIGPPVRAITSMGSKLESKNIMIEAGVPTLPSIEITDDLDAQASAGDIGFPVLVKASAGGGGKGMRIVRQPAELDSAVAGAIREAESAFGDGTVFLEKYLERPRHIEIQVFGDSQGNVVHLFERECSIQRRHQKVIEEAPSPAMTGALRSQMGEAAVAAAAAVGYVGAGTVEFLVDGEGGFYFLEMNTRLQVEHPVTEEITGLDLVRLQIEVAEGKPLPREATEAAITGHAIEVRLYAEDPANDYLPVTGRLHRFEIAGARVDTGVGDGSEISIFYDPMIAKVIVHASTRDDAVRQMTSALRRASIHGVTTNRELLVRVLESHDFEAGDTDTELLDRVDAAAWSRPLVADHDRHTLAIAAALAGQAARRAETRVLATLPSGWRNNPSQLLPARFLDGGEVIDVGYRIGPDRVEVEVDGIPIENVVMYAATASEVDVAVGGVRTAFQVSRDGLRHFITGPTGSIDLLELPLLPVAEPEVDPGSLLAPMPGKVVRIEAAEGDLVAAGDTLLLVEAMKMEHAIAAPHEGTVVSMPVQAGDQVESDQVLAVVEPAAARSEPGGES